MLRCALADLRTKIIFYLNGRTIGHSFVRVDRLVQFLSREEIREELLHLGDTGRASNQNDIVNLKEYHN